jgi:hypothetical protein
MVWKERALWRDLFHSRATLSRSTLPEALSRSRLRVLNWGVDNMLRCCVCVCVCGQTKQAVSRVRHHRKSCLPVRRHRVPTITPSPRVASLKIGVRRKPTWRTLPREVWRVCSDLCWADRVCGCAQRMLPCDADRLWCVVCGVWCVVCGFSPLLRVMFSCGRAGAPEEGRHVRVPKCERTPTHGERVYRGLACSERRTRRERRLLSQPTAGRPASFQR